MMKELLFLLSLTIAVSAISFSQTTITGNVVDEDGKPISNVSIAVKGAKIKTTTDISGDYTIKITSDKNILSFRKEGYMEQEVEVDSSKVNIVMTSSEVDLSDLSIEELININVISASNIREKLSEVPATMIVITAEDILKRGYLQLDEIFDDLPGMHIARPYGAEIYYRNYWRGYRNSFAEPYLIMVDGMLINDMFFGATRYVPAVPLSNVEHLEVVYGPVSSVYGANALMGVVNIITKKKLREDGAWINARTSNNFKESLITDIHALAEKGVFKLSFAGKLQSYKLSDYIDNNSYEYLKDKYQNDKALWGGLVYFPEFGASTNVSRNEQGIDTRLFCGNIEIGMQIYRIETGWGYEYPADKLLISTPHISQNFRIHFKHEQKLNKNFACRFFLAYRRNFDDNEDWIEGYNITNYGNEDIELGGGHILSQNNSVRVIDHSTWVAYSTSYLVHQDFDIEVNNRLLLNAGFKYELKNFSNQLSIFGTPYFPDSLRSPSEEGFLARGSTMKEIKSFLHKQNEFGSYIQSKYRIVDNHIINFGVRLDNNSEYGTNTTVRVGYIGKFGDFTGKLLYGQAYQAPLPRMLYGSWNATGSSIALKPEESQTIEASLNYGKGAISSTISAFHIINTNTIIQFSGGAENVGERNISGLDVHLHGQIHPSFIKEIRLWAYYSMILNEEEKKFDENNNETEKGIIGDLSHNNLYLGATVSLNEHLYLNLTGRYIGERKTVSSNPVGLIDPYFILNANVLYKNLFVDGLSLCLKVRNIFNTQYYHPGVKSADAGEIPGYWDGDAWYGSSGWYNSKLPQPHRYFMMSLILRI